MLPKLHKFVSTHIRHVPVTKNINCIVVIDSYGLWLNIWEVRIGKNCARGLEYVLKNESTVFPKKDRPRPANNVFIFFSLENYFIRNICVDFSRKQFHTVRVRLTFRSSKPVLFTEVFQRDSVFADFRTEQ